jgi:hypothetical protein
VRVPRKLWLAALVVALATLLAAQPYTVLVPQMDSYVVVNERTLSVTVGVAPCSWTRVTNVVETSREVRIKVETLPCPIPLPGTAALLRRAFTVSLASDLGSRLVEDSFGQAIISRSAE